MQILVGHVGFGKIIAHFTGNNAIKFTDGEGTVSIISEKKDNQAIVSKKDTGRGIDPEKLPKLFSEFVSKSFAGTGLGLYISKGIVEARGGKIWAQNNSDGKGATYTFSIPLIKEEGQLLTDRQ